MGFVLDWDLQHCDIHVLTSLAERELIGLLLGGLISKGVSNLPAAVESPGLVAWTMAAMFLDKGRSKKTEPSGGSRSEPPVGEVTELQPVCPYTQGKK